MAELDKSLHFPGLDAIEVDVEMLDFAYVASCNDWKRLAKIFTVLKSGKEGHYPELMRATEERMLAVMPVAEKKKYLAMNRDASPVEIASVEDELKAWEEEAKRLDRRLAKKLLVSEGEKDELESASFEDFLCKAQVKKIAEAAAKFNLDNLSSIQRERKADLERRKGNEYFKALDYSEAIRCYTNSVSLFSRMESTWTNRAIAYIKTSLFDNAEQDCSVALSLNPQSIKALSRRGLARLSLGKFQQAAFDFSEALKIQPSSKELQNLLEQAMKKYEDTEGTPFDMKSLSRTEQSATIAEIAAPVKEQPAVSQSEGTSVSLTFHRVEDKNDLLLPHEHFSLVCQGQVEVESSDDSLPPSTDTFVRIQIIEEDDEDDE